VEPRGKETAGLPPLFALLSSVILSGGIAEWAPDEALWAPDLADCLNWFVEAVVSAATAVPKPILLSLLKPC
jgi:hypothetical protein